MKYLVAIAALSVAASVGYTLCFATTENLVRVNVNACQTIRIGASWSRQPTHVIHKRGSNISGAHVTGVVIESTSIWNGDQEMRDYIIDRGKIEVNETASFFVNGNASEICPRIIGEESTFVTETPCCDTFPADGVCLVPRTMTIAKEEPNPGRWSEWTSPANK